VIPIEFINKAREMGACRDALEWLEQGPRTIQDLARYHRNWVAWGLQVPGFPELLSDAQFDEARKQYPGVALAYCSARLSDQQFDEAQKQCPWAALAYGSARLSDQQFDEACKGAPWTALVYGPERCKARDSQKESNL
jgi:hypothetical protein